METSTQSAAVERRRSTDLDRRVPTFDSENRRIRDYSEADVSYLVETGRMTVLRNRDGRTLFAQFLPQRHRTYQRPASKPKYKVVQVETQLPGVEACAVLFAVPLAMKKKELAAYQRAVFQQVLLSTMRPRTVNPPASKVVPIDSHRRYRRNHRSPRKPERQAA